MYTCKLWGTSGRFSATDAQAYTKTNYAATQGLPRHRQVSEAIYATACLSALSTQCIFRKGCVCIKNACSKPGAGKTPAGVRSYAEAFYGAHITQYISRSRCACIANASASQGLEDSGNRCQKLCEQQHASALLARHRQAPEAMKQHAFVLAAPGVSLSTPVVSLRLSNEMRMHYKCMRPARCWQNTGRCQELCNSMLRCSLRPVYPSKEMCMHYECMQLGLARHRRVSDVVRQHAWLLLAPCASLEIGAHASSVRAVSQGLARHRQASEDVAARFDARSTLEGDAHALCTHAASQVLADTVRCRKLCDGMLRCSTHQVQLSKEMRMHPKRMQPTRGWQDTGKCQKLCNRMLRCS